MMTTNNNTSTMKLSRNVLSRSMGSGRWDATDGRCSFDNDEDWCSTPPAREPDDDLSSSLLSSCCPTTSKSTTNSKCSDSTHQQQQQHHLQPLLNRDGDPWSDARVYATAHLWNLSEAKTADLLDMRERLQDVDHPRINRPEVVVKFMRPTKPAGQNDYCEKKIRKTLQWRKENGIDDLLDPTKYMPQKEFMEGFYPGAVLQGCDREGDPVFLMRPGVGNSLGLMQEFGVEESRKCLRWLREQVEFGPWREEFEREHGRPIKRLLHIEDAKDVFVHKKGVQLWLDICKEGTTHYRKSS